MVPQKTQRAGVGLPQSDLVYCYEAVIRPVMEYTGRGWHSSLTSEQSKTPEAVQRRACQIIIGGGTYSSDCSSLKFDSLQSRNTAYITCYPLQENSLLLIVADLPTNCHAYLQRLTDSKTLLLVIL